MAPFDPAWLKEQLEFFEVHAQQARASGLDGSIGAVIVATKGGDAKLEIKKKLSDVVLGPRLEEKPAEIDFRKVFDYKSKATLEIEVDASEFGLGFGTEKKEAATKRTVTAKVKVLRGIDLTKESWYSGSDPFVELTGATGSVAARTAVKKSAGGDSPVEWNEELSIKLEVTDDGVDVVPTHGLRAKLIDKCGFWRPDVLLAIGETSLAGLRAKEKAVLPIKLVNESVASFVKDQTDEGRANLANLRFLRKQLAEAGFAGHVQYTFGSVASSGSVEKGLGIVVDVPFEPAKPSEEEKIEGVHKDFAAWYEKKSADWRKVLFEAAYSLGFGAAHAPSGGAFELTEVVDAGHRVKVRVAVDLLAYVKTGQYQEEAKKRHEEEQRKAEEEEARKREELRKAQEEAARKEEEAKKKQQEKEAEEAKKQQPPQKAAEQEASEAKKDADTTGEKAKEKDGVPKEGAKEEAKKEEAQAAAEAKPVEEK